MVGGTKRCSGQSWTFDAGPHDVARLVCDQWVIRQTAAGVELTQRGTGWNEEEGSRLRALRMDDGAAVAASAVRRAEQLGILVEGAAEGSPSPAWNRNATGPTRFNTGYEQPLFVRRQFDLGYPAGGAVVLTLPRLCLSLTGCNTARGDWKPLNSGAATITPLSGRAVCQRQRRRWAARR